MKSDKRRQYLWTAAAAFYVLFVFSNSMKPADLSSADSGTVLLLVRKFLAFIGAGNIGITEHIIRKTAHFTEYTIYGILLYQCLSVYKLEVRSWIPVQLFLGLFAPFVDETIQLFTAGRSGQISDVWLDCAGVLFGTVIFACVHKGMGKIREGKREN